MPENHAIREQLLGIFLEYTPDDNIHTASFDLRRSERRDAEQGTAVSGPFRVRHVMEASSGKLDAAAVMIDRQA